MKRRLAMGVLSLVILNGCTTAHLTYSTSTPSSFNDKGMPFRIPRSQISITGKTGGLAAPFADTVIDPVPTSTPLPLPLNDKNHYYYTLDYQSPDPTGFVASKADAVGQYEKSTPFETLIASGEQSAWPVPTCGVAKVTLWASSLVTLPVLTVAAVPTELGYPSTAGAMDAKLSTLYRVTGVDDLASTTAVKITYVPNTKIVQSIGATVTDHVVDDLKTGAAIATTAAAFLAPAPAAPSPGTTMVQLATFTVTVGDNRVIQPVTLPSNGTITMNSTCGADRTDTSTGGTASTLLPNLSTLLTAAQSAYKAWTTPAAAPTAPAAAAKPAAGGK